MQLYSCAGLSIKSEVQLPVVFTQITFPVNEAEGQEKKESPNAETANTNSWKPVQDVIESHGSLLPLCLNPLSYRNPLACKQAPLNYNHIKQVNICATCGKCIIQKNIKSAKCAYKMCIYICTVYALQYSISKYKLVLYYFMYLFLFVNFLT